MGTGKKLGLGTVVLKCLHVHKSPGRLVGEKKKADCASAGLEFGPGIGNLYK